MVVQVDAVVEELDAEHVAEARGLEKIDVGSVEEIVESVRRATDFAEQLLAIGREQVLERTVADLGQIVADFEERLRAIVGHEVELTVVRPAVLGLTFVDVSRVEQVLTNLAVSAREAMPNGGLLTIEATDVVVDDDHAAARVGATPGQYVELAVTDSGTGMDAATQARIFHPSVTTKPRGREVGLGLVFGIVKQLMGHIVVHSAPGVGTTVRIFFPRAQPCPPRA